MTTNQNNAAQPVLTDDEIRDIEARAEFSWHVPRAIERAVLSKLRAPVADERAAFETWANNSFELHRHAGTEYSSKVTQCAWAAWEARAALASAPVGIPAGWRLVPITPTPEMESAGCDVPFGQDDAPAPATVYAAMIDAAPAASAPVVSQQCPTDVCQAAKADGVLCADDECDRANGVRPASATVAGEAQPVAWLYRDCGFPSRHGYEYRDVLSAKLLDHYYTGPDGKYVKGEPLYAAPQASEAVRDALMAFDEAMSLCGDYPELQHHRDALLFAVQKARAALSAQPAAQKERSDGNQ